MDSKSGHVWPATLENGTRPARDVHDVLPASLEFSFGRSGTPSCGVPAASAVAGRVAVAEPGRLTVPPPRVLRGPGAQCPGPLIRLLLVSRDRAAVLCSCVSVAVERKKATPRGPSACFWWLCSLCARWAPRGGSVWCTVHIIRVFVFTFKPEVLCFK